MYIILLYSLTSAQWSKITELGYRCATTASFKVVYVVQLQKKNTFEFVTERKICDGKDILVYNNNYQHKSYAPC